MCCRWFVLAVPTLLVLYGCTALATNRDSWLAHHIVPTRRSLESSSDADSLAAAALLRWPQDLLVDSAAAHPQALDLLGRAVAADPSRPEFVSLQIQGCSSVPGCNSESMEARLRELDPGNGLGWLGLVRRAGDSGDQDTLDAALTQLAKTDHVDLYWTRLVAELSAAAKHGGNLSFRESEVAIIGALGAEAIPAFNSLSASCKDDELSRPRRVEICKGVARTLQQGDTYITEMLGVAIAKRVWAEQSPEWAAATGARRLYEYRRAHFSAIRNSERDAARLLELCRNHRREQDVLLAELIDAGVGPNPPD